MFFETKFRIIYWQSQAHFLTAKQLFERVQKDSESEYNWIASATQLYRTCHSANFHAQYAEGIMLIILNCYANVELRKTENSHSQDTAQETVDKIYAEIVSEDETTKKIKEKYLRNIIKAVTMYTRSEERLRWHNEDYFLSLEEQWKEKMFERYRVKKRIVFNKMRAELYDEYDLFLTDIKII